MSDRMNLPVLDPTPATQLRLWFYLVVARLAAHLQAIGGPEVIDRFPFLSRYLEEMTGGPQKPERLSLLWREAIARWENALPPETAAWPLRRLRQAGLEDAHLLALVLAGAVEEDARFGTLYATLQAGSDERLTVGLLGDMLHTADRDHTVHGWAI